MTADLPTLIPEVAFATTPADSAPTWVDVLADFRAGTTTRGRQRELDRYQAGTMDMTLNNRVRTYDPEYAGGAHFPNVKPMRRVRLRAAWDAPSHLDLPGVSGAYASTPDSVALSITGDIDVRVKILPDAWVPVGNQNIAAKYGSAGNRSFYLRLTTGGLLRLVWHPDGTTGLTRDSLPHGITGTTPTWVWATLDVDNGAGSRVITFYKSTDYDPATESGTWTQISTNTTTGTTSIFDSTAPLVLGALNNTELFSGDIYAAEIRNGIDGTVVAAPDFAAGNGNVYTATTLTDPQGNTWTRQGTAAFATVATTYPIFDGYTDKWDQDYNPPREARATLRATDGFKVLTKSKLSTSAYAAEVAADSPVSWWRLGEPAGATVAAASVGDGDGTYNGSPAATAGLAANDTDGACQFDGVDDSVTLPTRVGITSVAWTIELWLNHTALGSRMGVFRQIGTQFIYISAGGTIPGIGFDVNNLNSVGATATGDGADHHVVLTKDGSDNYRMYLDGALAIGPIMAATPTGGSVTNLDLGIPSGQVGNTDIRFAGILDDVALYDTALSATRVAAHSAAGHTAWNADTPAARLGRILDIANWPAALRNLDTGSSTLQSATLAQTVLEHAQKVADSEFGELFITRDGEVRLVGRTGLLNRPSAATFGDGGGTELPYAAIGYDNGDSLIRNPVTVNRVEGVAQTSVDAAGLTEYLDHQYTLDGLIHDSDGLSRDAAAFLVSEYKDPKTRVVTLVVEPRRDPTNLWPVVLGAELGDVFTVIRRPQGIGAAISQVCEIQGIAHDIRPGRWTVTFTLSPAYTGEFFQLDKTSGAGLDSMRLYF